MNFFEVLGIECKNLDDRQIMFLLKLFNKAKEIEREQIESAKEKKNGTKHIYFDD